jgi:hypothetical protein
MNPEKDDGGKWDGSCWAGTYEEWDKYWEEQDAKGPKQLSEEERERLHDSDWAVMDPEVQRLYPDKYVAVYRRQIVASGDDLLTVMREAERITGLPQGKVAIAVIPGPGIFLADL